MSFLRSATQFGGIGAALNPSGAAEGLGKLLNVSPLGVSRFADTIGHVANGLASAGGAPEGYDGQQGGNPQQPNNYLQFMDPTMLRALMAKFGPAQNMGTLR